MAVSSQPVFISADVPSAAVLEGTQLGENLYVEDEEFPSDLASNYDRMLQPHTRRVRPLILLVAAIVAVLLVAVSVHSFYNPSKSGIFVLSGSR
jgi:hypothetical protein